MPRRTAGTLRILALAAACGALPSAPSLAQVVVRVNDAVFFQLGTQLQFWGESTQDPIGGGYSQSMYLRRIRLILGGQVAPNVTFFVETESSRLGNAGFGTSTPTKNTTSGIALQDAIGEWKLAGDQLILDAGLTLVPLSRAVLTSSGVQLSFDTADFSLQANALTQMSAGRDTGFMLRGFQLGGRLEYRGGVFSGGRQPATPSAAQSRNTPQYAARVQYNVFDPEKGYTYAGTNRGAKKILAFGAWGNGQGRFRSWGADVTADIPLADKSAVTAGAQYYFYDGRGQFTQTAAGTTTDLLPKQHAWFVDGGWYFQPLALQPYARYERLDFSDPAFQSREQARWGGGFNWYVAGQNLKLSTLYERVQPRLAAPGSSKKNTNHIAAQLQILYF
jgi:hypothetical protein